MSDLTAFRDHCRAMADARHRPDCPGRDPHRSYLKPDPKVCRGCVTETDRALFVRLADEVDTYLAGDLTDVDLFGDETPLEVS